MTLTLGFSPCPNDCFMFDAIVHRRIDLEGLEFDDRDGRRRSAQQARRSPATIDVTKLSYHAYAIARRRYVLLDAGSALGRGCGPLLISKRAIAPDEVARGELAHRDSRDATRRPTSCSASRFPRRATRREMVFSAIEAAVLDGRRRCRADHSRESLHLRGARAAEDHRSRRILGARDRRADPARRHRRPAIACRRRCSRR